MSYEQLAASVDALAATNAELVQSIYDGTQLTSGVFADVATGLANTTDGQYFSVVSAEDAEYLILYLNNAGVAVEKKVYPSATVVEDILSFIKESDQASVVSITDDLGFAWGAIKEEGFDLPGMEISPITEKVTRMSDPSGFIVWEDGPDSSSFGPAKFKYTADDGVWVLDELGFAWKDLLSKDSSGLTPTQYPSVIPYIANTICGVDGVDLKLYPYSMFAKRNDVEPIRVTIAAETNPVIVSSTEEVVFSPKELAGNSKIYARSLRAPADNHTFLNVTVKSAPNPPTVTPPVPKILLVGDSIGNHQGPLLINQFLTQWGYAPQFVGTYPSSIAESAPFNRLGAVCESRPSWSGAHFTYADPLKLPIVPGQEAAYLAMTKPNMTNHNPFIRAAVTDDPANFVKNGYIFDAAFYQSRFSLETPTIVINALNTNDFRDQTPETIYQAIYDADILMHTQFRAAWPDAKIIRCMPGAARASGVGARDRDGMWASFYVPAIRAMMDAKAFLNDPKITIASSWAFYSQEAGFVVETATTDSTTGAITGPLEDYLHPQGSTRRQYYQYLSGHVACAIVDLI